MSLPTALCPIQVLNCTLFQVVRAKGCLLESETDGLVLYFLSFTTSSAARGDLGPLGFRIIFRPYYMYISFKAEDVEAELFKTLTA